jgi:hypothetical protein
MRESISRGSGRSYCGNCFPFSSSFMDLKLNCDTDLVIYMSLNLTCHFLVTIFRMCEFELLTSSYRSCTLPQYSVIGRTVQPHKIVSKYIHQCADPKPARGSSSSCCEERFHTERMHVADPGDRGHTKVTGECPACEAAERECLKVHIVKCICYSTVSLLLSVTVRCQTRTRRLRNPMPLNQ